MASKFIKLTFIALVTVTLGKFVSDHSPVNSSDTSRANYVTPSELASVAPEVFLHSRVPVAVKTHSVIASAPRDLGRRFIEVNDTVKEKRVTAGWNRVGHGHLIVLGG